MGAGTEAPLGRMVAVGLLAGALGGCMSGGGGGGNALSNLFLPPAPTATAVATPARIEVADCPAVLVSEGGSAVRSGGGQVSVATVARECSGREDGAVLVKVGVEVRALLGPGSSAGRFEAPVTIVLKRGDQVLTTRMRRIAVAVPAGDTSQTAAIVEDGLVVPAGTGEFDIEVSLAGAPRASAPSSRRRAPG